MKAPSPQSKGRIGSVMWVRGDTKTYTCTDCSKIAERSANHQMDLTISLEI